MTIKAKFLLSVFSLIIFLAGSPVLAADLKQLAEQLVNVADDSRPVDEEPVIAIGDPGVKQGTKKPSSNRMDEDSDGDDLCDGEDCDTTKKKALDAFQDAGTEKKGEDGADSDSSAQQKAIREGGRTVGAGQVVEQASDQRKGMVEVEVESGADSGAIIIDSSRIKVKAKKSAEQMDETEQENIAEALKQLQSVNSTEKGKKLEQVKQMVEQKLDRVENKKVEIKAEEGNYKVIVKQKVQKKIFGFIPFTLEVAVVVDASGTVQVKKPWYSFIFGKIDELDYLKSIF